MRINELAKELEVKAKVIIDALPELGIADKRTHSSSVEPDEVTKIKKHFKAKSDAEASAGGRGRGVRDGDQFKPKIDISKLTRPGDVSKVIGAKAAPAVPPARPAVPVVTKPVVGPVVTPRPAAPAVAPPVVRPKAPAAATAATPEPPAAKPPVETPVAISQIQASAQPATPAARRDRSPSTPRCRCSSSTTRRPRSGRSTTST